MKVVIAGAGIIGLSLALELADAGMEVTVLEQGRAMREASWAAAGMLAVEDPENPPALRELSRWSRALYPKFLERVERLSGLRVPLRTSLALQRLPAGGFPASANSLRPAELLPGLEEGGSEWVVLEEASLDPRDLCAALPPAALAAGVELREGVEARRVLPGPRVALASGEILAPDRFVLAGGAWSGLLPLPYELPVTPRKGQMIEVFLEHPALPVVIRTPELYLAPRGDGRVAIGATVEDAGFDRGVDETAGDRLWGAAAELWPPIRDARITARWTGLRPGTADGLPILGELAPGIWIAAGHFRNGILLAPATARAVWLGLAGATVPVPLDAFSPARFAPARAGAVV